MQKRLESATVLHKYDIGDGEIKQVVLGQDSFALLIRKKDSTVVNIFDFEGTQMFRYAKRDTTYRLVHWITMSKDGSTIVLAEPSGPGYKYLVYDVSGSLRFEHWSEASIHPSPTVKCFCNHDYLGGEERLTLYRRDGSIIRRLDGYSGGWHLKFLSDDRLLVAERDTARIIDTRTGDVLRTIPLEFTWRFGNPGIISAGNDSVFAICGSNSILIMSADGEPRWVRSFDHDLKEASLDDEGSWLVMQLLDYATPAGYFRVISVENPDLGVESIKLPQLARHHSRYSGPGWFSGGIIAFPRPWFISGWARNVEYSTLFMEFDADSLTLSAPLTVPGLYYPVKGDEGSNRYLRVQLPGELALISIVVKDQR